MGINRLCYTTLFGMLITMAGSAHADIFALDNENGGIVLSNVPTDDRFALMLKSPDESAQRIQPPAGTGTKVSSKVKSRPYANIVEEAARTNEVDEALLHAVIATESGYNPSAVSIKGATGLMQLMPQTARRYGVTDRYNPSQNIQGGARYLKDLLRLFNNDLPLTLAAYNAGEGAVAKFGNKVPPYRETKGYVSKVMELYDKNTIHIY